MEKLNCTYFRSIKTQFKKQLEDHNSIVRLNISNECSLWLMELYFWENISKRRIQRYLH